MTRDIVQTALPKKLNQQQTYTPEVNDSVTDDPLLVTNKFNGFFYTFRLKLANNIESTSTGNLFKYSTNRVSNFIFLNDPSHNEILNTIMSLSDIAVGHDKIPAFFLKVAWHVITPYLLVLIQFSFSFDHDILPNNCKIACGIPIFKRGQRRCNKLSSHLYIN